jgi:proline dehydrogenase
MSRRFASFVFSELRATPEHRLIKDGYRLRIYIPYGRDWLPYFMLRLAERPANVAFFARNLLRRS